MQHTHTVGDKSLKINIDKGITQVIAPFIEGLHYQYDLLMFHASEQEKMIRVAFNRQLLTDSDNRIVSQDRIEFEVSNEDYDYFEKYVGIPAIKPSIVNGILNHIGLPKYFPVVEPGASQSEPPQDQTTGSGA